MNANVLFESLLQRNPTIFTQLFQNFQRPLRIENGVSRVRILDVLGEGLVGVVFAENGEDVVPILGVGGSEETLILDGGEKESSDVEKSDVGDRSEVDCEDESVSVTVDVDR